ncbi:MAG TPA: FlgD immunoglobulin-like domain containing protein [Candidatus Kapabacteria bacterium]|nr:FlgD immunoglobulin-like domain containing protein [Candidatus Kapabacteria bacterium]
MATTTRYLIVLLLAIAGVTAIGMQLRSSEAGADRTYVGQETCMTSGCHAGAYHDSSDYQGAAAFRQTMHQQIHLRPSPQSVVIDNYFEHDSVLKSLLPTRYAPIPGKDTLIVEFSKSADRKEYFIQMRISNQPDSTGRMKVAYTYGGNGWIQRFLINIDGSHYIVPFQYIMPGYRQRSAVGGTFFFLDYPYWIRTDSNTSEARFIDKSSNTFRSMSWDKNCASCHVNGFDVVKRVRGTDTSWNAQWVGVAEEDSTLIDQNIKIGCESCHGPGSEHVANPSKTNIIAPSQWPMTVAGTDLKLDLCNQCHNRAPSTGRTHRYPYDETNGRPYIPGQPLKDYVADMFSGMNVWPDRVTSYAHHQTGQDYMRSPQYASHVYKNGCWDCHTVHQNKEGLPYQLNKNWYSLNDGEGCLGCHGSTAGQQTPVQENLVGTTTYKGRTVNAHSMHSQEISQCVNCHYSKVASIGFLDLPTKSLYEFTDHSFKVIRPSATIALKGTGIGMVNTCAESCHRNGRGSRNYTPEMGPVAPAFGTTDLPNRIGTWNDAADVTLADSLWFHYQQMFSEYVSAAPETGVAPVALAVTSIAPNPFSAATKVTFTLARSSSIELAVYDIRGRFVRTLAGGQHGAGAFSVTWDGTGELGVQLDPGTYVVRLRAGAATVSEKVVLVR